MSNVWVVQHDDYDCLRIMEIFATEAQARRYMNPLDHEIECEPHPGFPDDPDIRWLAKYRDLRNFGATKEEAIANLRSFELAQLVMTPWAVTQPETACDNGRLAHALNMGARLKYPEDAQ